MTDSTLTFDAGWLSRATITGLVMPVRWTGTEEVGVSPATEGDEEAA